MKQKWGREDDAGDFPSDRAVWSIGAFCVALLSVFAIAGYRYGIESDSGREHIAETIREELDSLKTELLALGFSKRAIATAFKNVQEKGE